MRLIIYKIILFILSITFSVFTQINSVRIVYGIDPARAAAAGYNYSFVYIPIIRAEWNNGDYLFLLNKSSDRATIDAVRDQFILLYDCGLKGIPIVAGGSKWLLNYLLTNPKIDYEPITTVNMEKKIQKDVLDGTWFDEIARILTLGFFKLDRNYLNVTQPKDLLPILIKKDENTPLTKAEEKLYNTFHKTGCPSFAPDPDGFDKTFTSMLKIVAFSYQEAKKLRPKMPSEIKFIHFQHDEAFANIPEVPFNKKLLIGQSQLDKKWIYKNVTNSGISKKDDVYTGEPTPESIQILMADEIQRRINEMKNIVFDNKKIFENTKAMIWADMWDPNHNGSSDYGFSTSGVANRVSSFVKENLILMPWQYEATKTITNTIIPKGKYSGLIKDPNIVATVTSSSPGFKYTPSIKHFKSLGFDVIFCWAVSVYPSPKLDYQNVKMLIDWTNETEKIPSLGFCAAYWAWPGDNPIIAGIKKNVCEIMSAATGTGQIRLVGISNSTYYGDLIYLPDNGVFIDIKNTSKLDYFIVNQNLMYPDLDSLSTAKNEVNYFDAILYCNNLSKREGLDTLYSYNLIEYRNNLSQTLKIIVNNIEGLSLNTQKRGYRLPFYEELQKAQEYSLFTTDNEWISLKESNKPFIYLKGKPPTPCDNPNNVDKNIIFRIVKQI